LGKAGAIALELAALEILLGIGVAVLYNTTWSGWLLLVTTCVVATIGLAAAGTLYGVLAAGLRVRETLLPLLLLPVVAPVLLGATRAFEAALDQSASDGWSWVGLLSTFAVIYVAFGVLAFGSLLEES
jgi:heme exporter protein B